MHQGTPRTLSRGDTQAVPEGKVSGKVPGWLCCRVLGYPDSEGQLRERLARRVRDVRLATARKECTEWSHFLRNAGLGPGMEATGQAGDLAGGQAGEVGRDYWSRSGVSTLSQRWWEGADLCGAVRSHAGGLLDGRVGQSDAWEPKPAAWRVCPEPRGREEQLSWAHLRREVLKIGPE